MFFLLSIFIFSGCSLNVDEMNGNQTSETGLVVDDQTSDLIQTWATKKREAFRLLFFSSSSFENVG